MDPFSYLSVLISIVLALGMTRVLQGLGEMLQARSHRRVYWVHAVWVLNIFLFLVVAWWVFYRWRFEQNWTFFLFVFVLISPTILYLCSLLLFPREGDMSVRDYKTHSYANHRAFFTVFAFFVPVDVVDTLLKGISHFVARPTIRRLRYHSVFNNSDGCDHTQRDISQVVRDLLPRPHRLDQLCDLSHAAVGFPPPAMAANISNGPPRVSGRGGATGLPQEMEIGAHRLTGDEPVAFGGTGKIGRAHV